MRFLKLPFLSFFSNVGVDASTYALSEHDFFFVLRVFNVCCAILVLLMQGSVGAANTRHMGERKGCPGVTECTRTTVEAVYKPLMKFAGHFGTFSWSNNCSHMNSEVALKRHFV